MPQAPAQLAAQVTALVQELRTVDLYKVPGVSETLDWVAALVALDRDTLDPDAVDETLGVVLKAKDDLEAMRGAKVSELFERAMARRLHAAIDAALDNLSSSAASCAPPAPVDAGRLADLAGALAHVDLAVRDDVYTRAARCSSHRHERPRDLRRGVRRVLARASRRAEQHSFARRRSDRLSRNRSVQIEDAAAGDSRRRTE